MHRWWPRCEDGAPARAAVVLEPRVGGRWFERTVDGRENHWGHVLAWNPPDSVVLAWQIDLDQKFDPQLVTEVEIRFEAVSAKRTRVSVEHRKLERFGVRAGETRQFFDGPGAWIGVLEALRDAVEV